MQNTNLMDSYYSKFQLYAEKWSSPEGSHFTRSSLLCTSFLSIANTATKIFFTLGSLIPGSDHQWIKEKIDVEGLASDGFESLMKSQEHKFTAQLILPTLFKAIALTLNPYAIVTPPTSANLNKIACYSDLLFRKANEFAQEGMSNEELFDSTGDLLLMMEEVNMEDDEDFGDYKSDISNSHKVVNIQKETLEVEEALEPGKKWIVTEICTRALYLTATLAILVEKTIYLAAGVLFAACALCLGFKYAEVNQLALEYLGALDVIDDVCGGLQATFYPNKVITDQHFKYTATPKKL